MKSFVCTRKGGRRGPEEGGNILKRGSISCYLLFVWFQERGGEVERGKRLITLFTFQSFNSSLNDFDFFLKKGYFCHYTLHIL